MKKSYSLALWWWTAKWFAHIWTIKYIEENNIKIDEIAWTSMWSIIWASYAIWLSSSEIFEKSKDLKLIKLMDLNFKRWLISWKKISKLLYSIFWDKKIEDTKIPLKIVAVDAMSWNTFIFKKWLIVEAIRASISIPLIFSPYEIKNNLFFDWGLKQNLPVLALDWKNIIAVSVVNSKLNKAKNYIDYKKDLNKKWIFWFNYGVLNKLLTISMQSNEELSLEIAKSKWKKIIFISPDLSNFDYIDFQSIEKIVEKWYKESKKVFKNLI